MLENTFALITEKKKNRKLFKVKVKEDFYYHCYLISVQTYTQKDVLNIQIMMLDARQDLLNGMYQLILYYIILMAPSLKGFQKLFDILGELMNNINLKIIAS